MLAAAVRVSMELKGHIAVQTVPAEEGNRMKNSFVVEAQAYCHSRMAYIVAEGGCYMRPVGCDNCRDSLVLAEAYPDDRRRRGC